MSDDKSEELRGLNLHAMNFNRSKPTALGPVPGDRDKFGNVYGEPGRNIDAELLKIPFEDVHNYSLKAKLDRHGPIDYSKVTPEMIPETWQEVEVRRIKEVIAANPDMGHMELYKLLMEARGHNVPYRVVRCPKCSQGDSEKD